MKKCLLITLLVLWAATIHAADSPFLKSFKQLYGAVDYDLLSAPVEFATVTNFVYKKDLATFTFTEGKFYLARPMLGRPTTAIFIGKGRCDITVPSHSERMDLWYACGDSSVHETFENCFIRMADDFDLRLKGKFNFLPATLEWKEYNLATKQAQGEVFFRPVLGHERDNYFQLLRSCYERKDDGYFWADFNRYTYSFDPNRPDEVRVGFEKYPNDLVTTDGVSMRRESAGASDDRSLSSAAYQTKTVGRTALLTMGGPDGNSLDDAKCVIQLEVLTDSLRFTSLYLNGTLKEDSLLFEGKTLDFVRRGGGFPFVGVILPRYVHRGDTIAITVYYHGTNYVQAFPFVENPSVAPVKVTFVAPKGNEYLVPGVTVFPEIKGGKSWLTAAPVNPYQWFFFKGHVGGYTPISQTTTAGQPVTFLKSKEISKSKYDCFIDDETYQPPVMAALDYFSARFGKVKYADSITVFPLEGPSMPGLVCVPQVKCLLPGAGGLYLDAGVEMSKQWFGHRLRIASGRESWLIESAPYYLGTMFLTSQTPPLAEGVFFSELLGQRDVIYTKADLGLDQPLAACERVSVELRVTKGSWVLHMLRYLMFDIEKNSDREFLKFMIDYMHTADTTPMSNALLEKLAEQHYGKPLGWFFDQWVYGRNLPKFENKYTIAAQGDKWGITGSITTSNMLPSFSFPVICRVNFEDGTTTLVRQTVTSGKTELALGPFDKKPKEFVFNEFFSVLGHE